jgi:hypothetical protein
MVFAVMVKVLCCVVVVALRREIIQMEPSWGLRQVWQQWFQLGGPREVYPERRDC